METITPHQPYHDSPQSPRSTTPTPSPTPHTSPSSTDSSTTIKPLPPLPVSSPPYTDEEPYRDEPRAYRDEPTSAQAPTYHINLNHQHYANTHNPITTLSDDTDTDTDNIPLAHFLRNPYPSDAPPSYSVAVRQTHWNRDTLVQYIPDQHTSAGRQRQVLISIDPESGEVLHRTDDVRHGVEKVVAMFVVALVLLVLSGVLAWLAFGGLG